MADIGDRGELLLSSWCSEVDLVANISNRDLTGWDHIIEFPLPIQFDSFTVHTAPPQCKIQVKATNGNKRKVSLTLANLQRMVTDPLPTYILYIEYDEKVIAQKALLKHVDNALITKVLKKLHTINNSPAENKFNKRTMSISFSDDMQMNNLTGECLKSMLVDSFDNNFDKYVSKKKEFLESVGYEEGCFTATITTVGLENTNKLIDVSLGITDSVELDSFTSFKERFGIKQKVLFQSSGEFSSVVMSLPDLKPAKNVTVSFKKERFKAGYDFIADLFMSKIISSNDREYRYRLKLPFAEIVVWPNKKSMNFTFNLTDLNFDIWEGAKIINFLNEMVTGTSFWLSINANDTLFSLGKIRNQITTQTELDFGFELSLINESTELLQSFGISNKVMTNFEDLAPYCQRINAFVNVSNEREGFNNIKFKPNKDVFEIDKKTVCIGLVTVMIGVNLLSTFYIIEGMPEALEEELFVVRGQTKIVNKLVGHISDPSRTKAIDNALSVLIETYEQSCQILSLGFDENLDALPKLISS